MSVSATPIGDWLAIAEQSALIQDQSLNSLSLTALTRGVPSLPIADAIVSATVTLTIDGATTLSLDIRDPEWLVERSGILDPDDDGRMNAVAIALHTLRFRLSASRRRSPEILTLEFEDEAKALLDQHTRSLHASRGSVTRAEFIARLVAEVKDRDLILVVPQLHQKQAVARPDLPNARPQRGTGFDSGAKFKIQGVVADTGQMREVATAMGVADLLDVTPRVRLALLVAGIGESGFRPIANSAGSGYEGVFQADPKNIPRKDTEQQARYFLSGGKGFQAGGAIAYARANPHASPGEIATRVEASGQPASFYDISPPGATFNARKEADAIASLWQSGTGSTTSSVLSFKAFEFTRGLPGQKETSWQAATRLAQDVNWRFFSIGGLLSFVSDDWLVTQPAALILDALDTAGNWQVPDGLLSMPEYDRNHGKTTSTVTLRAVANAWSVAPGDVVVLRNMGAASGRWIAETFDFDLLAANTATITLIKPISPRKEPAATAITVDTGPDSNAAGAQRTLAWARSKLGHYREEYGYNTGAELNELEATFGLKGEPWCAMFATTALVHGGVPRECRTPRVRDINLWAQAGTHGFERGYRATPKPGDLMTFGDDHVAIVEKVEGTSVGTIEGNTSAGKVARLTRVASSGQFVRPDYPT